MAGDEQVRAAAVRAIMEDPTLVQAASRLAGHLHFRRNEPVKLPIPLRGEQDPLTDVPYPDWPYGADVEKSRAALNRFVEAGLLRATGNDAYVSTADGDFWFPIVPLFHVRNLEDLERRFPQLRTALQGKRVVDAGSGLCPYSMWLQDLGATEVLAVDYLPRHLEIADRVRRTLGGDRVTLMLGSIEKMDLPDASVDFVYCRGVVSLAHKRRTMAEFARILRPGGEGLLMLHAPSFYWRLVKLIGPSKERMRKFQAGACGMIAGAVFDWTGWDITWRLRQKFHMAYERPKSFGKLAKSVGLEITQWEHGIPKPFAWFRKR